MFEKNMQLTDRSKTLAYNVTKGAVCKNTLFFNPNIRLFTEYI